MHPYLVPLKSLFEKNANPSQAAAMSRYMRDQFEYLGIKTPQSADLLNGFIAQNGIPPLTDLDAITRDLWNLPQREFQYASMSLMGKLEKKFLYRT